MKISLKTVGMMTLLAALSACSIRAYNGPQLPASQEATLVRGPSDGKITIERIDGRHFPGTSTAHLLPGRHSVTILHTRYPYYRHAALWFEAEAGHAYQARAEFRQRIFRIWIEDLESGAPVGGIDENPPPTTSSERKRND
jgi:hypothetical protein